MVYEAQVDSGGQKGLNGLLASHMETSVSCVSDHPGDESPGHHHRKGWPR